ncbi:MAG: fibronectin type III domain-containing protein [Clostridiales bacterium]|nr:fibronectin type III domain-containing protein [Clostridiales bacterium]
MKNKRLLALMLAGVLMMQSGAALAAEIDISDSEDVTEEIVISDDVDEVFQPVEDVQEEQAEEFVQAITVEDGSIVDSGTCGDNLTWTLDDNGTLTIAGIGKMDNWSYDDDGGTNSPFAYGGYYDSVIEKVVIKEGITSIGSYAFYDCESLESVTIPDSVTSIGDATFCFCYNLPNVTVGNGVTRIGEWAFSECSSLTNIYFRGDNPSISSDAFYNITATAYYPNTWTSVPSSTDYGAKNITWVPYSLADDGNGENNQQQLNTWSFSNPTTSLVGFKHYRAFTISPFALVLSQTKSGSGRTGLCYGMATTAIATDYYNYPSVKSYGKNSLFDVSTSNVSSETELSAIEFIKYGFASQVLDNNLFTNQNAQAIDDYNAIIEVIKSYANDNGEPLVLKFHGHALWPTGIKQEDDTKTEVIIYDCNRPGEECILTFYKEGDNYTSWDYDWFGQTITSDDYTIGYVKSTENFVSRMKTLKEYNYNSYLMNVIENINFVMIASSNESSRVISSEYNGVLSPDNIDNDIITQLDICSNEGDESNSEGIYLAKLNDSFTIVAPEEKSSYSIAGQNDVWSLNVPYNTEMKVAREDTLGVSLSVPSNEDFTATYYDSKDEENLEGLEITGLSSEEIQCSPSDDGMIISGDNLNEVVLRSIEVDEEGEESYTTEDISVSTNNDICVSKTDKELIVSEDSDGDGIYENVITTSDLIKNSECDHNWDTGKVTTEATCKAAGVKTYTCKVCGETKTETIAKLTTHTWDGGKVTKAATCGTAGVKTYTCSVCKATRTEAIPATGSHTYNTTTTKAKPGANGKTVRKCSACGKVSTTTIYAPKTLTLSTTSYTYNGKTKKPTVKVKDSKGNTISSTHYTVSYASGRKYVGKYKVTVKFRSTSSKYSGTLSTYFKINPKGTMLKTPIAGSKSFTAKWTKQSTQTSGYQLQYSTSRKFTNAKKVTITSNKTTSKKITKLSAKKKYYVRVRTYKTVSGKKYYSSWSSAKAVTTKK